MNCKKLLAVFLLFTTLLLFVFQFFAFKVFIAGSKEYLISEALKQHAGDIQTITINADELYKSRSGFEWKEKNRELCIKGRYYEVLKIKVLKNKVIIHIVSDKKENELFRSFYEHSGKKQQGFILQCLLGFSSGQSYALNAAPYIPEETAGFVNYTCSLYQGYTRNPLLPPKQKA